MSLAFEFIRLMRPQQWYKNLLVFAAAFFSMNIFNPSSLLLSIYGFVILCLISSANYVINDLFDWKRDRMNPEKKKRPLAAGTISRREGVSFAVLLYAIGFYLSYSLNLWLFALVILFAALTTSYTFYFKNIAFADVIVISTNFVLRAIAGVILIGVDLSPWFFLSIFSFSFFLVFGKRYGDLMLMGKGVKDYKPVMKDYDADILRGLIQVFLSCLIILYGLYAFFTSQQVLLFLYPIILYIFFRYYYLVSRGSRCSRDPEKVFITDKPILLSSVVFVVLLFILMYLA